jgi:phosphopantothenoylcysteine decarboxylase/phosphopantothenate--cysteine ligase
MRSQRRILIGISGGIAAYKVCTVISALAKAGADVRVILTEAAQQFITPLAIATLSRHRAYTDADFWQAEHGRPLHIALGEWAEVLLIAPATANTIGKLAHGLADNLLTNTVLASRCPVLIAPAMNTDMWEQPVVQRNWQLLGSDRRYWQLTTGTGVLACDRVGAGRMVEPELILTALDAVLHTHGERDFQGQHFLVTGGGTREYLDPGRFIGNPSSGRMGVAIAQSAFYRGATVTLIHTSLGFVPQWPESPYFHAIAVETATELQTALEAHFPNADVTWMVAAVADVKPAQCATQKLPKAELPNALPLAPVPDLVAQLAQRKQPEQKLIGFAAQTGDFVTPALEKLQRKQLDAIVANPIDEAATGFGTTTNRAVWIAADGTQREFPLCEKAELAHHLLDQLARWR